MENVKVAQMVPIRETVRVTDTNTLMHTHTHTHTDERSC